MNGQTQQNFGKKNNMQIAGNKTIKDWRNLVGDAKNLKIDYNSDEKNDAKIGDTVRVMETRPLSKDKRWRLVEIMERAK